MLLAVIKSGKFNKENMEYRGLGIEDQIAMKELHAEWFPIDYPQEFFDRMRNPNVIALGCFYNV